MKGTAKPDATRLEGQGVCKRCGYIGDEKNWVDGYCTSCDDVLNPVYCKGKYERHIKGPDTVRFIIGKNGKEYTRCIPCDALRDERMKAK